MVASEDIKLAILLLARKKPVGEGISAREVAEHVNVERWKDVLDQVQLVISSLEQEGTLEKINGHWRLSELSSSSPSLLRKS